MPVLPLLPIDGPDAHQRREIVAGANVNVERVRTGATHEIE